jgi:hypothetical protein
MCIQDLKRAVTAPWLVPFFSEEAGEADTRDALAADDARFAVVSTAR